MFIIKTKHNIVLTVCKILRCEEIIENSEFCLRDQFLTNTPNSLITYIPIELLEALHQIPKICYQNDFIWKQLLSNIFLIT